MPQFYLEKLTIPWLIRWRTSAHWLELQQAQRQPVSIFYWEARPEALTLACQLFPEVKWEPLHFQVSEVRDESQGIYWREYAHSHGLNEVRRLIMASPSYQKLSAPQWQKQPLATFMLKEIARHSPIFDEEGMFRQIYAILVVSWHAQRSGDSAVFFVPKRPWFRELAQYAQRWKVELRPTWPHFPLKALSEWRQREKYGMTHLVKRLKARNLAALRPRASRVQAPKILVESFNALNFDRPEWYSDVFFWQQSRLPAQTLQLYWYYASPIPSEAWQRMQELGMEAVVTEPTSQTDPRMKLFSPLWFAQGKASPGPRKSAKHWLESAFLETRRALYDQRKAYFRALLEQTGSKVYLGWYRYDSVHVALTAAMRELGGITAIWQRSQEESPSPEATVETDLLFAFAPAMAQVEAAHGSRIPYHVSTGYLGDHRFALLRPQALELRQSLLQAGARKILAYFDFGTSNVDPRIVLPNAHLVEEYRFLLEKVLESPQLGVIFKSKYPKTILGRLGPLQELIEAARATGRCYFYEDDLNWWPPAVAAMAADVSLQTYMFSCTAALESALTGTPTVFVDRLGFSYVQLYELGWEKVVFSSFEHFWAILQRHWQTPGGLAGFGDWSSLLQTLDPFRDGRGAERLGTYLHWLIEGFQQGQNREVILEEAAERYRRQWGADKIQRVGD